jgi:hypothetical protein
VRNKFTKAENEVLEKFLEDNSSRVDKKAKMNLLTTINLLAVNEGRPPRSAACIASKLSDLRRAKKEPASRQVSASSPSAPKSFCSIVKQLKDFVEEQTKLVRSLEQENVELKRRLRELKDVRQAVENYQRFAAVGPVK